MSDLCEIGEQIEALQKESGLNDELLAGHLEVTSRTLRNWKTGKSPIKRVWLDAIIDI